MSEAIALYMLFLSLYAGGAALTGYAMGRAFPNLTPKDFWLTPAPVTALLLWPIGLPVMIGLLTFNAGQESVRFQPRKKGTPDDDGFHEYIDNMRNGTPMLIRWKEITENEAMVIRAAQSQVLKEAKKR